ncbi:MAG: hypothetical protein WKF78_11940 [Candidatus Limnocylindrales bacterium]
MPRIMAERRAIAGGRTPHDVLLDQLDLMDRRLADVADDVARHDLGQAARKRPVPRREVRGELAPPRRAGDLRRRRGAGSRPRGGRDGRGGGRRRARARPGRGRRAGARPLMADDPPRRPSRDPALAPAGLDLALTWLQRST